MQLFEMQMFTGYFSLFSEFFQYSGMAWSRLPVGSKFKFIHVP